MAAAVADFTPVGGQSHGKFMRDDALTITYTQTEDIVAELASTSREDQRVIAFALEESAHLEERGRAKLLRKKVDAIVANPLETMDSNEIDAVILKKDGSSVSLDGITTKAEFAHWLILHLEEILPTT
jgi:phosphopantothenoylcysteine synthetase/decarboxylase